MPKKKLYILFACENEYISLLKGSRYNTAKIFNRKNN